MNWKLSGCRLAAILSLSVVPAVAQAPNWARGVLKAPWNTADCMARAQGALQSEGYNVDWSGGDARHGTKGPVSAFILCESAPGGGVYYNLIVHTNGSRPAADEGAPLDYRMKNPTRDATGGGQPAGGSSGGPAGGGSGGSNTTGGTSGGGWIGSGRSLVNVALGRPVQQSSVYTWAGASAVPETGVDGKLGPVFHTSNEPSPWWQVDLGRIFEVQEVRIFNRMDCCGERARSLVLMLSRDGQNWQTVYSNDGREVGGRTNPLKINVAGQQGRYVRVQLKEPNYLHLEEVEVYAAQYYDASR